MMVPQVLDEQSSAEVVSLDISITNVRGAGVKKQLGRGRPMKCEMRLLRTRSSRCRLTY